MKKNRRRIFFFLSRRRLTENGDIFGATQFERRLMKREVRNRLKFSL
jgi:hypothetical protein